VTPAAYVEAAVDADLDALVALERLCFSHPWTPRNFADAMADPPLSRVVVLRVTRAAGDPDRGIAAYCAYQVAAGEELHVHNLAAHPAGRRRGWGRMLMRAVLALATRRGARTALLEVRRSNEAARGLYESLGFRVLATRRDYYRHPTEDALVMEMSLP
jgi:[ribosomal protein S18]-alanine N-acetyltransferase